MSLYEISFNNETSVLTVGFGDQQSTNDLIIVEAQKKAASIKEQVIGCQVLKVNGPASLPVAMMLCHEYSHVVSAIACFDPKLQGYVVCVSHSPDVAIGQIIN